MDKDVIACTLGAGDLRERMAWIATLNSRSLKASHKEGLKLTLHYDPKAIDDVRQMVAGEEECCAFLTFDIAQNAEEILVSIIAPEAAREAAEALFEPFASSVPLETRSDCGCSSECGA
jgi:hypothetical protein